MAAVFILLFFFLYFTAKTGGLKRDSQNAKNIFEISVKNLKRDWWEKPAIKSRKNKGLFFTNKNSALKNQYLFQYEKLWKRYWEL